IYEFMFNAIEQAGGKVDGCSNLEDIILRYKRLDSLKIEIGKSKKFKTQNLLNPKAFNEEGGVYVHITRDNQIIFGGGGFHRLAIAKILKLNEIPAQLGVIHSDAIDKWKIYKKDE